MYILVAKYLWTLTSLVSWPCLWKCFNCIEIICLSLIWQSHLLQFPLFGMSYCSSLRSTGKSTWSTLIHRCICVHPEGQRLTPVFLWVLRWMFKQLHAYEVEYHVLQDELQESSYACGEASPWRSWRGASSLQKRQNMDPSRKILEVKRWRFDHKSCWVPLSELVEG